VAVFVRRDPVPSHTAFGGQEDNGDRLSHDECCVHIAAVEKTRRTSCMAVSKGKNATPKRPDQLSAIIKATGSARKSAGVGRFCSRPKEEKKRKGPIPRAKWAGKKNAFGGGAP